MKRKPKQKRSIILKVLILAFSIYMLVTLSSNLTKLNELQKELDDELAFKLQTEQDINELKEMLKDESNKQIIEKAARERLGYIYSDEQVFIDISGI
jgi:cell division protein FtsB